MCFYVNAYNFHYHHTYNTYHKNTKNGTSHPKKKYDSLATSKNLNLKHRNKKIMNKIKLHNTKNTCKYENIMPWNIKLPKVI
jgi:hypothetical protein